MPCTFVDHHRELQCQSVQMYYSLDDHCVPFEDKDNVIFRHVIDDLAFGTAA